MDTYTVTFTNGNSTTFTVTNGEKGDKGDKGDKGNTGSTGATGNGISTVAKTGTSGLVDTYTITFTNGNTTTFTVTNGADGTVPIVTSWESTLSDSKVPSEKLTKNALDGKLDNTIGSSAVTIASNDNILITDYSDSNKVKKVANLLASQVKDSTAHSNIGSSANDTQATINSDIDTALSNKVSKSSTTGLLKNDGTVDTTSYSTFDGNYNSLTNKPTIPSASSTTPSADTTSGSYGSGTSYARANHTHPKSSLYAESSHTHTKSQITDFPSLSTVATSGSYADLSNKPSIPSSSSDLSDGSDLVKKSSTSGLLKNDGSVDTNAYITSSALPTIQTSWGSTTSDSKVASEKLIKSSLDGKLDNTIGSSAVTIASDDNILITDTSDNSKVKKVANILASQVKDSSAHSNIGSSANATQSTINTKIDTELANRLSVQQGNTHRNMNVVTDDLGNITFEAKATVESVSRKMDKFYFKSQDFITPSEWYFDYSYFDVIPTVNNGILNFTNVGNYLFIFNDSDGNWVEQSRHLLPVNYTLAFTVTSTNSNSELHIGGIYSGGTLVNVLDGSSNCTIEIVCVDGVATVTNSDTQNSWTTDYGWYVDPIKFVEVVNIGTIAISNFSYAPYTSMELIPSQALIEDNELSNINTGMGATQSAINSAINTALGNKGEVVTSWSSTLTDTKVPSEKLVKNYVDNLVGSAIQYIVGSGS